MGYLQGLRKGAEDNNITGAREQRTKEQGSVEWCEMAKGRITRTQVERKRRERKRGSKAIDLGAFVLFTQERVSESNGMKCQSYKKAILVVWEAAQWSASEQGRNCIGE